MDVRHDAPSSARATLLQRRNVLVGSRVLLAAEGGREQAVIARVQAQTNRYGDATPQFQALGGGGWNRE